MSNNRIMIKRAYHPKVFKMNVNLPYNCLFCGFSSSSVSKYQVHLKTKKHQLFSSAEARGGGKVVAINRCELCRRRFMSRSGMLRHEVECKQQTNIKEIVTKLDKVERLAMAALSSTSSSAAVATTATTTTNTNINRLTLDLYLQHHCKSAPSFCDFVRLLNLQKEDVVDILEIGYIQVVVGILRRTLSHPDITGFCSRRPLYSDGVALHIKHADGKWNIETIHDVINDFTQQQNNINNNSDPHTSMFEAMSLLNCKIHSSVYNAFLQDSSQQIQEAAIALTDELPNSQRFMTAVFDVCIEVAAFPHWFCLT